MANEFKPVKFGCGRYVQAPGSIEIVGREAELLHCKKALIVAGQKAYEAAGAQLEASLKNYGVDFCDVCALTPHFFALHLSV